MKKFTNKNVQKEVNKMIRNIIIFFIIILIAIGFGIWGQKVVNKTNSEIQYLDDIIVSYDSDKINKKAYLNIANTPYEFATNDETIYSYYIVSDGELLYIAYMGSGDFATLNKEDIKENPVRVEGITHQITDDIKELALEAYNIGLTEEDKITSADFASYFGSVYLDITEDSGSVAKLQFYLLFVFAIVGIVGIIASLVGLFRFKNSINRMDLMLIEELDSEMNDENAFYYNKAHLYLTNKYVINFDGKFVAIDYEDIVWMYPYEYRVNGVKSSQAIMIMDNMGKVTRIANIEVITKAKKEIYNEIWNTIIRKNNKIVLGYTKENIKEMNEKYKKKTNNL